MLLAPSTGLGACHSCPSGLSSSECPIGCLFTSCGVVVGVEFRASNPLFREVLHFWVCRHTRALAGLEANPLLPLNCCKASRHFTNSWLCHSSISCGELDVATSDLLDYIAVLLLALSSPPRLMPVLKWLLFDVIWQSCSCPASTSLQVVVGSIWRTRKRVPLILLVVFRWRVLHHALK